MWPRQHIAGLRLRYYYAGLTQITDRSLEMLGGMVTLEQVEFYECKGVTDAGLAISRASAAAARGPSRRVAGRHIQRDEDLSRARSRALHDLNNLISRADP